MRIGCIYTLKNEEELLAQNMDYHRHIGVTDFYAFLDHSTDGTKRILQSDPDARIFENLGYDALLPHSLDKPKLDMRLIREKFAAHNGVRQILHANMALDLCRADHIDWLIHLDPDELICLDAQRVEQGGLARYLERLDPGVGAVIFKNLEAVPTQAFPEFVFSDTLFKNELDDGDIAGMPRLGMPNPYTKDTVPAGWFWGHTSGKLAVRVTPNAYFTHFTHLFHTEGETITADVLLHYNIISFAQFLAKYRNFKDFPELTSFGRKVRPLRTLFVALANDARLPKEALLDYYNRHIIYTPVDIEAIRSRSESALIQIRAVADYFRTRAGAP